MVVKVLRQGACWWLRLHDTHVLPSTVKVARLSSIACQKYNGALKSSPRPALFRKTPNNVFPLRFLQAKIQDNIVYSPYPEVVLQEKSVGQFLLESCDKHANEKCVICSVTGQSYTYKEIADLSKRIGCALVKKGFAPGDILCISSANNIEYVAALIGTLSVGGVLTTTNPLYTVDEMSRTYEATKPKFIICDDITAPKCVEAAKGQSVQEIFTFNSVEGFQSLEQLVSGEDPSNFQLHPLENVKDTVAIILFSSGTTGLPKGTLLTHHNIVSNLLQFNSEGQPSCSTGDVCLGLMPFFHSYGIFCVLLNSVYNGSLMVNMSRFTPSTFLETITKYNVTYMSLVPYLVSFLAKDPVVLDYDLSKVKLIVSGASMLNITEWLHKGIKERLPNATLIQGFGMTELSPVSHNHPAEGIDANSVGFLVPHTQAKIVDIDTGEKMPAGKSGEMMIKGPQVMKGYLNNEEATKSTLTDDRWLHTGDIGYYDDQGKFYLVDRIKELIKFKGLQVSPTELETFLCKHEAVQDAGVTGIPDVAAGELPAALVTLKPQYVGKVTTEDLHQFMSTKLSSYKQLSGGIKFVDAIPRNATGKILRKGVKEAFTKQ